MNFVDTIFVAVHLIRLDQRKRGKTELIMTFSVAFSLLLALLLPIPHCAAVSRNHKSLS